ncbi:flagellar protein FlgN [Paenibacillus daejeonensis]|uniref:flagellar protein FlgN n=1 Tax=Paenibacillus daejeonensis TaxID=135193 RepID=UPI00036A0CE6|nr:flagellar protein FlgN [Paenibacillus daejeonensis]
MNEPLQVVMDTLHQLTDLHRDLSALGRTKREALGSGDIDTVAQTASRESKILQKITELDKQRLLAIGQYVARRGFAPTGSFRMEQLIQMVFKAEEKQALRDACVQLNVALLELQEINEFNQQMIRLNLEYVSHSIDLIAGPPEEDATYHRSLQAEGFKRFSQFDTRA